MENIKVSRIQSIKRRKEWIFLILFAEIIRTISHVILILSAAIYFRYLDQKRKTAQLSKFEYTVYILIQIAFLLLAISLIIFAYFN